MKRLLYALPVVLGFLAAALFDRPSEANPSGCPNVSYGQVWTAGQWNACLATIQGLLSSVVNSVGATNGSVTVTPTTGAVKVSLNDGYSNTFTALQSVNLNTGTPPTALPGAGIQVSGAAAASARVEVDAYAGTALFTGVRADGTQAAPTAVQSGDEIASFNSYGYGTTSFAGPRAAFRTYAAENWTDTHQGTRARIATTPLLGTTLTDVLQFESTGGVTVPPTVTGGDKGAGTVNAAGLYVAGTAALTASKQVIGGATGATGVTAGTTVFIGNGAFATSSTEQVGGISPFSGTFKKLYAHTNAAPGSGKNVVFTLMKNGVATALTCTINGVSATDCNASTDVSWAAGDRYAVQGAVDAGATAGMFLKYGLEFDNP